MFRPRTFRLDSGHIIGRLFGTGFVAILGIGAVAYGVWSHSRVKAAESWATTQGVVESSAVSKSRSSKGRTTYKCRVTYRFVVDGRTVNGDTMDPLGNSGGSQSNANDQLRRYPKGAACTVHYDPEDPTLCCLEPGSTVLSWVFTAIGGVMLLGGALGLVKAFHPMGRVG